MSISIFEAFKALDALNEEDYNITANDIDDLKDFVDEDEDEDVVEIIDPEAETEEDLEDSYIGKVALNCCVCHTMIYKDPEDVNIEEDGELANIGEECPYCYSADGYKIEGKIEPFSATDLEVEVEPKEDADLSDISDEPIEGDELEDSDKLVSEGLENIDLETDHDNIHISATEKVEAGDEMIAPLDTNDKNEILGVDEEPIDDFSAEEEPLNPVPEDEEEIDYDMEDFDEDTFNDLGESYLKKVYENVESFSTTSAKIKGNKLTLEGIIKFNSGKDKKTQFIFEAKDATKAGKVRFIGENAQITRGKKAFTLTGKVVENKLISESLNYNYRANKSRIYGTVKTK